MRKKLPILFIGVLLLFGLSACASSTQNVSFTDDILSETGEEISESESVSIPDASVMPKYFYSETELQDTIVGKTELQHGPWNPESITSLTCYFKPENLPKDCSLSYITVDEANVVFCYQFDKSPDGWKSNVFLIEWFRTLGTGDMEKNVDRWFSENEIEHYNEYDIYVYKVTDEIDKKDYSRQDIFWEQDGYAFHAIAPIWFTKEDISEYCNAAKVNVE